MKRNCTSFAKLGLIGLAIWVNAIARAQDEPQTESPSPQASVASASAQALPAPSTASSPAQALGSPILPSMQAPAQPVQMMGRSAIAQLSNPFERGGSPQKRGLIGLINAQPSSQSMGPPAGFPGETAGPGMTPGAGPAPGGVAAPGAERPPGAPSTETIVPPTAGG